jgi:hypothetical protein
MRLSQAICIIYLSEARTEVQRPELASPGAAAIVARRESRSAMPDRMPERLKVAARDDSSDDEWGPEEVAGALQTRRTAMRSVAEDRQTVVQMAARKCVRVLITSR